MVVLCLQRKSAGQTPGKRDMANPDLPKRKKVQDAYVCNCESQFADAACISLIVKTNITEKPSYVHLLESAVESRFVSQRRIRKR